MPEQRRRVRQRISTKMHPRCSSWLLSRRTAAGSFLTLGVSGALAFWRPSAYSLPPGASVGTDIAADRPPLTRPLLSRSEGGMLLNPGAIAITVRLQLVSSTRRAAIYLQCWVTFLVSSFCPNLHFRRDSLCPIILCRSQQALSFPAYSLWPCEARARRSACVHL